MSVTSAPIGSTGQSLDGFGVDANVLQAFRESVVIAGPNTSSEIVTPVSTQPVNFYGLPVWIQGTPQFSSTVNITSTVNVTSVLSGQISSFAVNPLPGTTMVNVVSTVPQSITIGTVSTFPLGTTSTQIVSSIPFFVTQSTSPWIVSSAPIALVGTSQVFGQVSTFPTGQASTFIANTPNVNISSSIPLLVTQSATSTPWVVSSAPIAITGTTMVNVVSTVPQSITIGTVSTFPLGTTSTQIVSSIPIIVAQSTSPWVVSGQVSSFPTGVTSTFVTNSLSIAGTTQVNIVSSIPLGGGVQYVNNAVTTQPTGNVAIWAAGAGNSTMAAVSSSNPLPIYQISTGPVGPLQGTSMVSQVSSVPLIIAYLAGNSSQTLTTVNASSAPLPVNIVSSVSQSTNPIPIASGGLDTQLYVSVTTAPKSVKNSAGRLYDIWFTNSGTSMAWLKLFNASSASVSTGTTAPLMTFGLPASPTTTGISGWLGSGYGYNFSTAIACSVTASSATSTDTSTPPTNQILLQFGFK